MLDHAGIGWCRSRGCPPAGILPGAERIVPVPGGTDTVGPCRYREMPPAHGAAAIQPRRYREEPQSSGRGCAGTGAAAAAGPVAPGERPRWDPGFGAGPPEPPRSGAEPGALESGDTADSRQEKQTPGRAGAARSPEVTGTAPPVPVPGNSGKRSPGRDGGTPSAPCQGFPVNSRISSSPGALRVWIQGSSPGPGSPLVAFGAPGFSPLGFPGFLSRSWNSLEGRNWVWDR